ncbi:MAG: cell surface protein [Verrucomicrobia bacterium]|nr:MAG: cell surface protein [Verrucomicrobiota bacterium]
MPGVNPVAGARTPRPRVSALAIRADEASALRAATRRGLTSLLFFLFVELAGAWLAPTNDWQLRVHSTTDSSPAVAPDGTIYLGLLDGHLWAVNPDGTEKWKFRADREIRSTPAIGADGSIYFGCRDRKVYALTPDGKKKWTYATGWWVDSSPALGSDGTIYVASWDSSLHAITPDGKKKWTFETRAPIFSSPAIGTNGVIYFGSTDGSFYALKPDGQKLWAFATENGIMSSPALDWDGHIYFTSLDGFFYALNADGTLRWKRRLGSIRKCSPVISLDGTIFCSATSGIAVLSADGQDMRLPQMDSGLESSFAVMSNRTAVCVFGDGQVIAYSHEPGFQWRCTLRGCGDTSPALGPTGTIYLVGFLDHLVAIHNEVPLARTPWPKFRGNARNTGNLADSPR